MRRYANIDAGLALRRADVAEETGLHFGRTAGRHGDCQPLGRTASANTRPSQVESQDNLMSFEPEAVGSGDNDVPE